MAGRLSETMKSIGTLLAPRRQQTQPGVTPDQLAQLAGDLGMQVHWDGKNYSLIPTDLFPDEVNDLTGRVDNINKNAWSGVGNRSERLRSYAKMDASGAMGTVVLDTIADETLNITDYTTEALEIRISDPQIAEKVKRCLEINEVLTSARQDVRSMCKWGDSAYVILPRQGDSLVVDPRDMGSRLPQDTWYQPADLILRFVGGDHYELQGAGNRVFDLRVDHQGFNNSMVTNDPLARAESYRAHEFALFSIRNRDTFPYGQSVLEAMRVPFEKLNNVETLLAVTRANKMDRIAIMVPNLNLADPVTALAKLNQVKNSLKNMVLSGQMSGGAGGRSTRNQDYGMTEYLFVPENFKVQKLATSIDFGSTADAEYFRDQAITASRMPKSYFLADGTDTRPGTLRQMDVKFARSLIPVGEAYCNGVRRLCILLAFYMGANLAELEVTVKLRKSSFISEDLVRLYGSVLQAVNQYIDLQKKVKGEDFQITVDEIRKIVRRLDAPEELFFDDDAGTGTALKATGLLESNASPEEIKEWLSVHTKSYYKSSDVRVTNLAEALMI